MALRKSTSKAKPPVGLVVTADDVLRLEAKYGPQQSQFYLNPKQIEAITRTERIIGHGGAKFGGKAGHVDSKVLTPFGWRRMGDMKVGSLVSNPTGSAATVIGVFPQGKQKLYRVTCSDGASTLVTGEHLWLARLTARKLKADRRYFPFREEDRVNGRIFTTDWLRAYIERENRNHPERDENGNGPSGVLIPLSAPVEFSPGTREQCVTVDPWVLGVLLGDGCLRSGTVTFTSVDEDLVQLFRQRSGHKLSKHADRHWGLYEAPRMRDALSKLGVYGCLSHEKFIPDCYKWSALETRWDVVRGLMDTDGYADARGHCSYTTVSERLADDMREILWTLGFKVSKKCGPAGYKKPDGEYVPCRDAFTLYIQGNQLEELFLLARKRERAASNDNKKSASAMRRIVSIEPEGEGEAQCIQVDHPNSLYLTDGCIVTHNSLAGIRWMISGNKHIKECESRRRYKCSCTYSDQKHHPGCNCFKIPPCTCQFPDYDADGKPIMVNRSYIYHPKFLGCVLRENTVDLRNWINEAKTSYEPMGGEFKEGDHEFVFPSGATVFCGHYQDDGAFTKYAGLNIVRFLVEEATHIPNVKKRIQMLNSCCRSIYPEMKAQLMLTFNPGGVSHGDILEMFVKPRDKNGDVIPPGTTITEEYNSAEIYARLGVPKPAEVGDKIVATRVFIFSSIKDNPAALVNQEYIAALMGMDEEEREAYLFGNWEVLSGTFFSSFRPTGPMKGEPAEANHVVPYNIATPRIKPWWWRTMSCDWGYSHECAVLWGCHDQERDQFWITDEMVVSQTEPDLVGEEIARRSLPILRGLEKPQIVMGLSHDAYGTRQDDRSIAELIARGMSRILGPNMVHVPDLLVDKLKDKMEADGQSVGTAEADAIFNQIRNQQRMGITIRRMRDNRIVGWQYMRSMMRWKSTMPEVTDVFDPNLASRIAYEKGLDAYTSYMKLFQQKREILPKLQIVGPPVDANGRVIHGTGLGCSRLINAIPKLTRDDTNPEDVSKRHIDGASDVGDSCRYLLQTFRNQTLPEPFEALRQRTVAKYRDENPNVTTQDLVWVNRQLEADQKRKTQAQSSPIHITRPAMRMRAQTKGLLGPASMVR